MDATRVAQDEAQEHILKAYESLKGEDLPGAVTELDSALEADFEHLEVAFALKCANFWNERVNKASAFNHRFEKGEYLLSQWKAFLAFLQRIGQENQRCLYAFRQFVFGSALRNFLFLLSDPEDTKEAAICLRIGRCYKLLGEYDRAKGYLELAVAQQREDAESLAELADAYALLGESRPAKALFREAFFADPAGVDMDFMESELVLRLRDRVRALGLGEAATKEWMPVYGVLWGVLNVKRELRPIELGKLKQAIFALENESRDSADRRVAVVPRLINRYFWLVDHYMGTKEDRARIDEVLLKIKLLDSGVHKLYTT